ncbi:tyrosine recombinase XerC [Fructobacillus sp. M1-13]|uniref:Tyrosine recombinase XerC n=1 Tax=Fructobacillus papyriferae TaxID=2713171 RepID=A0ABS5QRZ7_9LACO|nr:tyrosine recombinase XerC [Fructobacillus papyriferae]MBS9334737.1 tyrosine recombinase XerC [Fructobacillus papyriferae]MCD2158727.1 tyrosine recombinase XerC [Fructobacillus papyriferae]
MEKLAEQYQSYLKAERGYSNLTIQAYEKDIAAFVTYLRENGGFTTFQAVQPLDVRVYLASLYEAFLARTTIARKVSSLKNFYAYLVKEDLAKDNPFEGIALRKHQAHLPEFLYDNELQELFKVAYEKEKHPLYRRDAALLEFLFATGVRVSELSSLRTGQVDLDNQLVLVHGKGNKDRYVPFGSYAKKALVDYLENERAELASKDRSSEPSDHLFLNSHGGPLTSAGVTYILQQLMDKTSLTARIHPHMLRHTFATALLNRGADMRTVQELLGHANLSTTQIYTHVSKAMLQSSYQNYFPRAKKKK